MKNLVIVAHPDDETLFFSSILQSKTDTHVVCVTDANADGEGEKRKEDFKKACALQGATSEMWDFQDIFEKRLDQKKLQERLKDLKLNYEGDIYTHSIIGEYGHPHHQDVSFAVHSVFKTPNSVAYNTYPKKNNLLTPHEFNLKKKVLAEIYLTETKRFQNLIPATFAEGFTQVSFDEVQEIYYFLTEGKELEREKLKTYAWLIPHLKYKFKTPITRIF